MADRFIRLRGRRLIIWPWTSVSSPIVAAPPRILISNGFHRLHLAYLPAGLRQPEWDVELLAGAYAAGAAATVLRNPEGVSL